jgi:hypothetical protein
MPLENPELDPVEADEWLEAVEDVIEHDGPERAEELLGKAVAKAHSLGAAIETSGPTAYVNTIPADQEPDLRLPEPEFPPLRNSSSSSSAASRSGSFPAPGLDPEDWPK